METLPALAVESFSYSWLSNARDPLDYEPLRSSLDSLTDAFFQEFDHKSQNFDFNVPISHSPIHADEIFYNGLIKPLFINPSKLEPHSSHTTSAPISAMPVPCPFSSTNGPNAQFYCHILGRWRKSSGQMVRKCVRNLSILCRKARRPRKSTRVGNICYNSPRTSPLISSAAYSTSDWYSDNMENSIHEAVLYCKRSIEK